MNSDIFYHQPLRKNHGTATGIWLRWLRQEGWIVLAPLVAALALLLSGCVNCYTRCPGTDGEITEVYQSSRMAAGASLIVAFPQMMSDVPGTGFDPFNIFTIPLGVLVLGDAVAEAAVDTVCLPVDCPLSRARRKD